MGGVGVGWTSDKYIVCHIQKHKTPSNTTQVISNNISMVIHKFSLIIYKSNLIGGWWVIK